MYQLLLQRDARAAQEAMLEHIRKSRDTARSVTLNQIQQQQKKAAMQQLPKHKKGVRKNRSIKGLVLTISSPPLGTIPLSRKFSVLNLGAVCVQ